MSTTHVGYDPGAKTIESWPVVGRVLRLGVSVSSLLPLSWARGLGAALGLLCAILPIGLRRVSALNVRICFPDWSATARRWLVRRSLVETGKTMMECAAIWRWSPERLARLTEDVVGEELLRKALDSQRGAILLLPHVGNWEFFNPFLAKSYAIAALYRPPRIKELDGIMRRSRERTGCTMVPATTAGVRRMGRALREGKLLIVLPDQEPVKSYGGVFAPFFGVPAWTMTLVSRLSRRYEAPVLYAYAERRPTGRFRVYFRAAPDGLDDAHPEVAAARLNLGIEACVRACPEQYHWCYKRFKTRPPGEHTPYRRGADGSFPLPAPAPR